MAFSKIVFNGTVLMDLTNDTVEASKLLLDYTATGADGLPIVGTHEDSGGGGAVTIPIESRTMAVSIENTTALVTPYAFDFNVGYINSSTTQQQQATATWTYQSPTDSYSDIYIVDPLSVYWLGLGGTVGARFRVGYFNEDPTTKTASMNGTLVEYKSNPSAYDYKFFTTNAPFNNQTKYLVVQKDNVGVTGLKSYLVKIDVSTSLLSQS